MIRTSCILAVILMVIMLIVAVNVTGDAQEAATIVTAKPTAISAPTTAKTPKPTPKPTKKPTKTQPKTAIKTVFKPTDSVAKTATKITPKSTSTSANFKSDLDLLARLVYAEAGSDWCSDEMQLLVANVVINRMNDGRFPDTLRGVIYQRGQYACVGKLGRVKPNARAIKNAKRVLNGERFCPAKVVWQSESRQGKHLWKKVGNQYFCY